MKDWDRLGRLLVVLALWPLLSAGCASSAPSYIHPNVDFSFIRRCAILPFQNLSGDDYADERIHSIFFMEVLREGTLELVGPGEVRAALMELRINPNTTLAPADIASLGERLSVDAVFSGVVEGYGADRGDRARGYEVTAAFEMTETQSGVIIWRSQVHAGGISFLRRLFGGSPANLHDVSRQAVREALSTLY